MKLIYVVLMCVLCSSCSIQFKGKDLELDAKPAKPNLEWSLSEIGFYPGQYLVKGK